jgi:hypothetical protein
LHGQVCVDCSRLICCFCLFVCWMPFVASCSVLRSVLGADVVMQRASFVPDCDCIICFVLCLHWSVYPRSRVIGRRVRSASDKTNLSWKAQHD